jgi:hypothetical protein
LFKLTACRAAQLGASSPQVMWGNAGDAHLCCVLPEHLPDDFLAKTIAGYTVAA